MIIYFLYNLVLILFWPVIYFGSLLHHKGRDHILEQYPLLRKAQKKKNAEAGNRQVVVFHAASAGEFEQLKPILKRMDRTRFFIVQTFFSPTIYKKEKDCKLVDAVCYHPVDFIWAAIIFFSKLKPRYFIITRHDIWPNHLRIAKIFGVKTILINANLHKETVRLKPWMVTFSKWMFSLFDEILTGSERLKKNFAQLSDKNHVKVTGDTRFDQIIDRIKTHESNHFPNCIKETRNVVFGSLIPSDYPVVFKGIQQYFPEGNFSLLDKKCRLIIVPHEIKTLQLKRIEKELEKIDITYQYYSNLNGSISCGAVIVDTVGILADLYIYAELAYVGAGFGAGVHSVIEPAVHGCVSSFGPNIGILDEAITMHELGIGKMIHNSDDFCEFLKLLEKNEELAELKQKTMAFIEKNKNNAQQIIDFIFNPS